MQPEIDPRGKDWYNWAKEPGPIMKCGHQRYSKACLHAAGIMLGLGHPDIKSSLLIGSSSCCIGLLVGVVDGQLVKCDLRKGSAIKGGICIGPVMQELAPEFQECQRCSSHDVY